LSFEQWIFFNGQPARDDYRIIFLAMTATEWQRSLACLVLHHYVNYDQMLSANKPVQYLYVSIE